MRWLWNTFLALVLFALFLILRFPYETLVERSIVTVEESTGAAISWTPESAGPLGVQLKDLDVQLASGARLSFAEARLRPTWTGLAARLSQEGGGASVRLNHRELELELKGVQVDTASPELGVARLSGSLVYDLQSRGGRGDLLLEVPKFEAPLMPETPVEMGAKVTIQNQAPARVVTAELKIVGGQEFLGEGTVVITAQAGGSSPALNGTLRYEAQQNRGTLRIGGTWENPTWSVMPSSS